MTVSNVAMTVARLRKESVKARIVMGWGWEQDKPGAEDSDGGGKLHLEKRASVFFKKLERNECVLMKMMAR